MEEMHRDHQDTETPAKETTPSKEIRRRKKRLLHQIANQMDFYFSPANITKDRFMSGLLAHGPYVHLETFFKFNKIRSMTSDLDFLRKAISKSSVLELSEDRLRVRRKEEVEVKNDELQCTIYVENIPSNADHEWVREVFGEYGTIDYISLPRYHRSGRPKGFAFVEFKTPEMANSALEAFGALECKIPTSTDPAELQSIKTFEGNAAEMDEGSYMEPESEGGKFKFKKESSDEVAEKEESVKKRKLDVSEEPDGKKTKEESDTAKEDSVKEEGRVKKRKLDLNEEPEAKKTMEEGSDKRRLDTSEEPEKKTKEDNTDAGTKEEESMKKLDLSQEPDEKKTKEEGSDKKRRLDTTEEPEKKTKKDNTDATTKEKEGMKKRKLEETEEPDGKKRKTSKEETQPEQDMEEGDQEQTSSVKKKKKKRKRKKREKEVIDSIYLRVMSKEDWKKLRNKYLNAQRENMKLLKMQMQERYQSYRRNTAERNTRCDYEEYSRQDVMLRTGKTDPKKAQSLKPEFTPDSVIKIRFEEPPHDVKKLRETIREGGGGGVAYVDLSATERDVFVRFTSSEAAAAYRTTGCWKRMELLSGEEEEEYWKRIITCWSERRNKKNKNSKPGQSCAGELRGREKLLQKAFQDAQNTKCNSHIVFDD